VDFHQFVIHSLRKQEFLLSTQAAPNLDDGTFERVEKVLEHFAERLSRIYRFKFSVRIKKRIAGAPPMGHDRYMFTDQVKLLVSRGFDLVVSSDRSTERGRRIRDVSIKLYPTDKAGDVETTFEKGWRPARSQTV
jgi:hypothetical protein